jgi:hypothetical protein
MQHYKIQDLGIGWIDSRSGRHIFAKRRRARSEKHLLSKLMRLYVLGGKDGSTNAPAGQQTVASDMKFVNLLTATSQIL